MTADRYAAGVDGGGTKAALCCVDAHGHVLYQGIFGPLNINRTSPPEVRRTLEDIIFQLAKLDGGLSACAGITIAAAGASNPDSRVIFTKTLWDSGYKGSFNLRGDHEAALRGAVGTSGAVLVSGTGSICFGRNDKGQTARAGGWGYLLDDEGSGYTIGRDILRAILRAEDGREAESSLADSVRHQLNAKKPEDIVHLVYAPDSGKASIASLAPLLEPACLQGDKTAKRILEHTAHELFLLSNAVILKLHLENSCLALAGGVLNNNLTLSEAVRDKLGKNFPRLKVIKPRNSPSFGAADLAREAFLAG